LKNILNQLINTQNPRASPSIYRYNTYYYVNGIHKVQGIVSFRVPTKSKLQIPHSCGEWSCAHTRIHMGV